MQNTIDLLSPIAETDRGVHVYGGEHMNGWIPQIDRLDKQRVADGHKSSDTGDPSRIVVVELVDGVVIAYMVTDDHIRTNVIRIPEVGHVLRRWHDSRVSFGLDHIATMAQAEAWAKFVRTRGDQRNGGMLGGMPLGYVDMAHAVRNVHGAAITFPVAVS